MNHRVEIAVRHLVEYVFRGGSLEGGFRSASTLTEGTKAHQKIQKQYGEQDQKEVYLSIEIPNGEFVFIIDGRCDGLLVDEDGTITIDEIKSTAMELEGIDSDTFPVHWAQAKCYAYMYAKTHDIPELNIQLTYVQVDTEEHKRFMQTMTIEQLEAFVIDVIEAYAPYVEMLHHHRAKRDASIDRLAFPFPAYRKGQRKLAGSVYTSIAEGVKLFAQAPTGIGKTMSTIFPTVKAMGTGLLQGFFYLTAKTITRTAAEEALARLRAGGLHLHAVTITAKEKICFQDQVSCRKEDCIYADGYYDRVNEAILDMLSHETLIQRGVIEAYARKHRICPFEFSLDAAYAADAVICDYNYIFDPRVSLKRQFAEQKRQTALLIDEAHNLVDRSREMFSSLLSKSTFLAVQREYKAVNKGVFEAAKAVNAYFIRLRKQAEEKHFIQREAPEELLQLIEAFIQQAERELANGAIRPNPVTGSLLLETYFEAVNFAKIGKLYDERYVTYVEISSQELRIRLFCLDPSHLLREMGKGYRSHIYFSATLSPIGFYRDMLGADRDDYTVSIPSPFSSEQLEVVLLPLSTRYRDRELTMEPLATYLQQLTEGRPGNYLFFFPSYAYMNMVYERFMAGDPLVETILQHGEMSEEERESYLAAFEEGDGGETLVGFAVMGGIFSEGIDLVGNRLTGVVIVGVGLPQIGPERNIMRDYFDHTGRNGYDYAYVFPGMNKVLQAGGRLIRSEQDTGLLVLVDDRYLQPHYARLLPAEWSDYAIIKF
ncbi:ATP-dependent DNA helicase [Paenibacillus lentus]|uniref:ATP-dependent DNA helicase n=1 Tax=Paenibacillus lentus TaxID=1338368 RepID=A0A3Q8S439_9BACL|nr:ATP-dependent DNA helicase [Paenibacillus lentus]AZK45762.1 ATP-dependent DNA helicase [Paenibacillus lentus]